MNCEPCKRAGEANAAGNEEKAQELHSQCAHPETCTCQHRTGPGWIRATSDRGVVLD